MDSTEHNHFEKLIVTKLEKSPTFRKTDASLPCPRNPTQLYPAQNLVPYFLKIILTHYTLIYA
jgi:hypothetical protein